jgi:hypothetical protein
MAEEKYFQLYYQGHPIKNVVRPHKEVEYRAHIGKMGVKFPYLEL